jgi:hypothetical protein
LRVWLNDDDGDTKLMGKLAQAGQGFVVCLINWLIACGLPDLGKHVNHHHERLAALGFGALIPSAKIVETALMESPPLSRDGQPLRPFAAERRQ